MVDLLQTAAEPVAATQPSARAITGPGAARRSRAAQFIVTRTPLRVSFAGGGTDLPAFSRLQGGAVLSTTIDKYVYVTVKRHDALFEAPIRLNYSETEEVSRVSEIRNDIARAVLEHLAIEPPIYISTVADLPAASGLGSSSAFCVGLLHALYLYRGERPSAACLAEQAAHIEIERLGRPIGKQDHYAAAYGGFNLFRFLAEGGVSVESQQFPRDGMERFFRSLMLVWTGLTRDAARVLGEQQANTPGRMIELGEIRDQAIELRALLARGLGPREIGEQLDHGWRLKRRLAGGITTPQIDAWYERARAAGALGGRLCGAGGGGFLLLVAPPSRQAAVAQALDGLTPVAFGYEPRGSRLLAGEDGR